MTHLHMHAHGPCDFCPHPQHVTCTDGSPERGHSLPTPSLYPLLGPSAREVPWSSSSLGPSCDQPSCGRSPSGPPVTAPGGGAGGDGPGPSLAPAPKQPLCATWSFLLCHAWLGQQALSRPSAALRVPRRGERGRRLAGGWGKGRLRSTGWAIPGRQGSPSCTAGLGLLLHAVGEGRPPGCRCTR